MSEPGVHRICVDVSEEVYQGLVNIPHGMRKYVIRAVIESLSRELKGNAYDVISAVLKGDIGTKELLNIGEKDG